MATRYVILNCFVFGFVLARLFGCGGDEFDVDSQDEAATAHPGDGVNNCVPQGSGEDPPPPATTGYNCIATCYVTTTLPPLYDPSFCGTPGMPVVNSRVVILSATVSSNSRSTALDAAMNDCLAIGYNHANCYRSNVSGGLDEPLAVGSCTRY